MLSLCRFPVPIPITVFTHPSLSGSFLQAFTQLSAWPLATGKGYGCTLSLYPRAELYCGSSLDTFKIWACEVQASSAKWKVLWVLAVRTQCSQSSPPLCLGAHRMLVFWLCEHLFGMTSEDTLILVTHSPICLVMLEIALTTFSFSVNIVKSHSTYIHYIIYHILQTYMLIWTFHWP